MKTTLWRTVRFIRQSDPEQRKADLLLGICSATVLLLPVMNVLGKYLLLLIATLLVADPVMACCLPSAHDLEVSVTQTDKPPCHGSRSADTSETPDRALDAQTIDQSCPGCGDCSSAMSVSDHSNVLAFAASLEDSDDHAADDESTVRSPVATALVVPRFPSGLSVRSAATPITLKQRLLI